MSQSSRNKNLLLSTPYVFQRQLFDFLCLETRLMLRKCSKRCELLVDYMPLTLDSLDIKASTSVTIKYCESKNRTNDKLVNLYIADFFCCGEKKEDVTDCVATKAANEIGIILSNPNLKIGLLGLTVGHEVRNIQYKEKVESFLSIFLKHLKLMLSSLSHQINVQCLFLEGNSTTPENYCVLLSCLKPEKLKSIIFLAETPSDTFHKIAHLEQIKRVSTIDILYTLDRVPFEILSNTSMFRIFVENFSEPEFNRIVEHHLQRDNFMFCRIHFNKSDMEPWITDFLIKNAAVKTDWGSMTVTLDGPKFKNTISTMPQNSRNKNLLLSTPYLFQRQLYDFLCLETRLNLRKCSKRCQSLVDNMPLTLDFLAIKASSYVNIKYSESKIHTEDEYVSSYIAILILCVANEVRNIQYKEKVGSLLAIFLKHLKSIISSLPHQINVQHFSLGGNLLTPENYCELLSSLKSEKLESISLFGERTGDSLDKIAHLEQIKRVPSIEIRHVVDRIPFDMLSNTPNYLINVRNISELEFIRIVEHHLQRDNFEMGRFCVMKSDMEPWITDFLVKNAAVNKDDGSMTVTLEGPKFKNTVNVDDEWIVFRRMI
ncbi:hypothetical protein GCK72_004332 [Caenorhabditis remanei]|uniref:DUF38 domain-containing protein n=1 Tax=Caenorhabditis remanei TaxID=31234 RepID=A0A6A5HAZ2_CAERE|nr:hypothetical protein GCK72_004332 [Caenorhabditis remanei]KAF1764385.1 hypothetical protein GCK72_004332 [Caenorhabditis remanei]